MNETMQFSSGLMIIAVLPLAIAVALLVPALGGIRRSAVSGTPRILWTLLVFLAPIVGPICWFIAGQNKEIKGESANNEVEGIRR